jgi:hypothetical protein
VVSSARQRVEADAKRGGREWLPLAESRQSGFGRHGANSGPSAIGA